MPVRVVPETFQHKLYMRRALDQRAHQHGDFLHIALACSSSEALNALIARTPLMRQRCVTPGPSYRNPCPLIDLCMRGASNDAVRSLTIRSNGSSFASKACNSASIFMSYVRIDSTLYDQVGEAWHVPWCAGRRAAGDVKIGFRDWARSYQGIRPGRHPSVRCRLPAGRMSMVWSGGEKSQDWLSDKGRNDARCWPIHSWRSRSSPGR